MTDRESVVCEHCGAKHVVYRYKFNKSFARSLLKAARSQKETFSVGEIKMSNAEYATFPRLKYWGLTEPVMVEGDRKKGLHRITKDGWNFLGGKLKIPSYVFVRTRGVLKFEGPDIFFKDVTGGYDYSEDYKDQVRAQL